MRLLAAVIIFIEIVFGALYAAETPRWQAPDEPAHYNYVRHVAETGSLPVLQSGDYDQAYLEKIKSDKFPSGAPVDRIRYESYQPPLYYVLAAPIYLLSSPTRLDTVLVLRLFSVFWGAILLILAYRVLVQIFPGNPLLTLAGLGFIATVPMHIAMSAAINADILAEVIIAAIFVVLFSRVRGELSDRQFAIMGGVLYGLALLSSTKAYPSALLLVIAEAMYRRLRSRRLDLVAQSVQAVRVLLPLIAIALLISGWWFMRNALTYGGGDIFGWLRHDAVVTGQPTTAEWVGRYGLKNIVSDFLIITFKSFWAQFGWMGVLISDRIYVALFILTAAAGFGLALFFFRISRKGSMELVGTVNQWILLGVWLLIIVLAHVWYNLRFVQPQGRYLFPALIPIAGLFILGLNQLLSKRAIRPALIILYILMLALDYGSLYWYIIPQLRA